MWTTEKYPHAYAHPAASGGPYCPHIHRVASHGCGRLDASPTVKPMNSHIKIRGKNGSRARPVVPPLLHSRDLPGPMSLSRLSIAGTVRSLDGYSGYWADHGDTLYGRALIVHRMIPSATAACMRTALWVWMGGAFPETVDVLSGSHYRTLRHGRPIRVFARKVGREQLMKVGELDITSPQRTVCDIASTARGMSGAAVFADRIADLMHMYRFTPDECEAILAMNPCTVSAPHARAFLNTVRLYYEERKHAKADAAGTVGTVGHVGRGMAKRDDLGGETPMEAATTETAETTAAMRGSERGNVTGDGDREPGELEEPTESGGPGESATTRETS